MPEFRKPELKDKAYMLIERMHKNMAVRRERKCIIIML